MKPSISLHSLLPDDWRVWRSLRLEALAEAPYAFSSKLEDWQNDGDTERRWRGRLTDVPLNVIADLDGTPAGMVSATHADEAGQVTLISMWVAPFARGRGVGDALVGSVIVWAREGNARRVALCVMEDNEHAAKLYLRHGFTPDGESVDRDEGARRERRMTYVLESRP
jgi:RimJ/RimL family protein N-acetyltransferase